MKVSELSIKSQKKLLKNAINCVGYTKYFHSVDDFLDNYYEIHIQRDPCQYYNDVKAEGLINITIAQVLDSDINCRIVKYIPQTMDYASDCHLHFSILTDDSELTQELVNSGAVINEAEIALAATFGRASILKILLDANPTCNKPKIDMPYSYGFTNLFWASAQTVQGYEADYSQVKTLLNPFQK